MPSSLNRREMLRNSLGTAASLCVAGRLAAQETPGAEGLPFNRSATAPSSPVAVTRCESYDPQEFRKKLDQVFNLIGGLKSRVENKTVTIKVNLTGMVWKPAFNLSAYETYQTHPNTLAAPCAVLSDAGAKRIIVAENLYWDRPFEASLLEAGWGRQGDSIGRCP